MRSDWTLVSVILSYWRLDKTGFAFGGSTAIEFAGGADMANTIALQSDGKVVVAGHADGGGTSTRSDFALVRYNSDGTLDTNFGVGGKVTTDFGTSDDYIEALKIQPQDGKVIVAGHTSVGPNVDFALARYNPDGTLDASFGTKGKTTTDIGGGHDYAYALALQSDGTIVAAGYTAAANRDFACIRLTSAGALDTHFGNGGKTQIDFSGGDDQADSIVIQDDGKIVLSGWAATANGDDFAMVRLNP